MERMQKEDKKNLFVRFYRTERSLEFLEQCDKERAWKRIMQKRAFRRFRTASLWVVTSAACLALVAGLLYLSFFTTPSLSDAPMAILQKTYPEKGGSKALLVLDNGEVVDLTARQGAVAKTIQNVNGERLIYDNQSVEKPQYNTLSIPRGGEYQLVLSDGTHIWMNAESSLRYPVSFSGDTREVTLEGEAYFEVAHDEKHPFKVHTALGTIGVLGTSFNVSAYPQVPVCATLVSGSVAVSTKTSEVMLAPGRQALLDEDGRIETREVDASFISSWRTGTYLFQNMPLRDIAAQLSRWYDVDIRFRSAALEDIRFTGGIVRDEELAFAVDVIERISSVHFERSGNTVWIMKKEYENSNPSSN